MKRREFITLLDGAAIEYRSVIVAIHLVRVGARPGDGARSNSSAYRPVALVILASLPYFAVAAAFAYFLYPAIH